MSDRIFQEGRSNVRVKESAEVAWEVNNGKAKGKGKIRNISTSGMLLETNSNFIPSDQAQFRFDSTVGDLNFLPENGRLVWFKKKNFSSNQYLCGIRFEEINESKLSELRHRVQKGIEQLTKQRKFGTLFNIISYSAIVGLSIYAIILGKQIYLGLDKSNQNFMVSSNQQAALVRSYSFLYHETKKMLETVTNELNSTKEALKQAEAMLQQEQEAHSKLKEEFTTFKDTKEKELTDLKSLYEQKVADLESKNIELTTELDKLQDEVRFYEGNVKSIKEGNDFISLFKNRMRSVKSKINGFQKEVFEAKIAAFKERDRIRMKVGNNGFLTKDGVPVRVDEIQYNAPVADVPTDVDNLPKKDNVKVDVTVFE